MFLLAPWPNRIADARFTHDGNEHALRADFSDGSAIHGIVKDHPWRILDRSPVSARFGFDSRDVERPNWPFAFQSVVRFEIDGDTLIIDLAVQNVGDAPMPAGLGLHPFFMRTLLGSDTATIRAHVSGQYPSHNCLPTGPPRETDVTRSLAVGADVGGLVGGLDDCFAGLAGPVTIRYPGVGSLDLSCTDQLGHLVLYTPAGEDWFCVEPVTMANNGFNLPGNEFVGVGVRTLAPHEALATRTAITINFE